ERIGTKVQPDIVSGPERHAGRCPGFEGAVAGRHGHDLRRAEILCPIDLTPHRAAIVEAYVLRPDPEDEIAFRQFLACRGNGNVALAQADRLRAGSQAAAEWQEIHRRRANEVCNEE